MNESGMNSHQMRNFQMKNTSASLTPVYRRIEMIIHQQAQTLIAVPAALLE